MPLDDTHFRRNLSPNRHRNSDWKNSALTFPILGALDNVATRPDVKVPDEEGISNRYPFFAIYVAHVVL